MTSILHSLKDNYKDWQVGKSAEVDAWFLMDGPGIILAILAVYLTFVLKVGPSIMKNRPAMELKKTIIVYNGLQVLFSMYLVYRCSLIEFPLKSMFSSACSQKLNKSPKNVEIAGWWYFFAKVTELLDTVFFVLRKRSRQISFLHVYHHSNMVFFTWSFLKYSPSVQGGMVGILNSTVHVVMYTYYMIAAMGPKYQKYIWWKKYMTIMQLVQFCIIITYLILLLCTNCGQSRGVSYFFILNAMGFLILFADFYRKSYEGGNKHASNKTVAGRPILEDKVVTKPYENGAYAQISRDAELLSQDTNLRKRE